MKCLFGEDGNKISRASVVKQRLVIGTQWTLGAETSILGFHWQWQKDCKTIRICAELNLSTEQEKVGKSNENSSIGQNIGKKMSADKTNGARTTQFKKAGKEPGSWWAIGWWSTENRWRLWTLKKLLDRNKLSDLKFFLNLLPLLRKLNQTSRKMSRKPTAVRSIRIKALAQKLRDNNIFVTAHYWRRLHCSMCHCERDLRHTHWYFLQNPEIRKGQKARDLINSWTGKNLWFFFLLTLLYHHYIHLLFLYVHLFHVNLTWFDKIFKLHLNRMWIISSLVCSCVLNKVKGADDIVPKRILSQNKLRIYI